jgi:sugar lactone lactonase YvrE
MALEPAAEGLAAPGLGAVLCAAALLFGAPALGDPPVPARVLPGIQPDGTVLLHNQWKLDPAGRQVPLGDFPVAAAVDPAGRRAAVLHAGYGPHEVRLVDLGSGRVSSAPVRESFEGIAFARDGRSLYCSGGSDGVLHRFRVSAGGLSAAGDVPVCAPGGARLGVVAGFALSADGRSAIVAVLLSNRLVRVDLESGRTEWSLALPPEPRPEGASPDLVPGAEPLCVVWDEPCGRAYASLWGESGVAVVDTRQGTLTAQWQTGLHPNEMVLSPGGRLFVSNGGLNTVTVLDTRDGRQTEVLSTAAAPGDPPGSTPDSLALSRDGSTLYAANAYTNTVAVFDVSLPGLGRPLGFIPTGWFPTSVRLTRDGRRLLVVSARGLAPKPSGGQGRPWTGIAGLYSGSLGILDLPGGAAYGRALGRWTVRAARCRPAQAPAADPGGPVPAVPGGPTPLRYVVYIIKENRTYDQVFGDLPQGNGDPSICLFPEKVTPNLHAIARQFVLLDNFYANAEVSAGGHEWSMAGYSSEFVERTWPVNYGHGGKKGTLVPYTAEGRYLAAVPALGYLWDRAAAAGVTFRSYGEFTDLDLPAGSPMRSRLPSLQGKVDPDFRGWDLAYTDRDRASEFIAQLHAFEARGDMPRLQVVRLPNDHTAGAAAGKRTPRAMVADNDLAVGRVVEALSNSRFWARTAVFIVEDDAQNGPDHVDAHRTEALVAGAYVRRGAVDSTAYTTCSMLRTIELVLGLEPMSQFDAAAAPMRASFQASPDLSGFRALPPGADLGELNPATGPLARESAGFNFSREDLVDEAAFNRVIWASVRGPDAPMPAPVKAAFVRRLPSAGDDDD